MKHLLSALAINVIIACVLAFVTSVFGVINSTLNLNSKVFLICASFALFGYISCFVGMVIKTVIED